MRFLGDPTRQSQAESPAVQSSRVIDLVWRGGMIFDGQQMHIEEEVIAKNTNMESVAKKSISTTLGAGMSIVLNRKLDFSALGEVNEPAEDDFRVSEMILVEQLADHERAFKQVSAVHSIQRPVVLENQTFDQENQLVESLRLVVPRATVDSRTDSINGHGPGSLIIRRLFTGNQEKRGIELLGNRRSSDSKPSGTEPGVEFVRVNFDQSLVVNTKNQDMTVTGNVRTLYAPTKNFQEEYSPDENRQIPKGSVKLTCREIQTTKWTPQATNTPTTELLATGNARFVSDTLEATAERISYDESSDFLTIEGSKRSDANVWIRDDVQGNFEHVVAVKFSYRLSDKRLQIEKVRNASSVRQ